MSNLKMNNWPHQNEAMAFYGDPRHPAFAEEHLTHVSCPWEMYFGAIPVSHICINKKCAESLERILQKIWEEAGESQTWINEHHYQFYSGSFNYRPIRGENGLSMHAYGCAIDIDAGDNPMGRTCGRFNDSDPLVKAFKAEGWVFGGDWCGRKDSMHFQAAIVH